MEMVLKRCSLFDILEIFGKNECTCKLHIKLQASNILPTMHLNLIRYFKQNSIEKFVSSVNKCSVIRSLNLEV